MEKRTAKVNISAAGGTAAKESRTCKVTLPTTWLEAMGISESQRELELSFDGSGSPFPARMPSLTRDTTSAPSASTMASGSAPLSVRTSRQEPCPRKSCGRPGETAFGNNPHPTWADFQAFLEERCIPRQRAGLREYLEAIGVAEYDPLQIIQKTKGRMAEDQQWLEVPP